MRIFLTGHIFTRFMDFVRTHELVLYCHCYGDASFSVRLQGCKFKGCSLHDSIRHGNTIEEAISNYIRKINKTTLVDTVSFNEIDVGTLIC